MCILRVMNQFILSSEQEIVLKRIGTLTNIVYDDIESALQTIDITLAKNIQNSKASIVVVRSELHRAMLKEHIHFFGLKDLMMECNPNSLFTEEHLSYIRSHALDDGHPGLVTTADVSTYYFNKQNKEIIEGLESLQKKVFGDLTWKQLLHMYLSLDRDDRIYQLHAELSKVDFDFNQDEFNQLYGSLSDVLYLYEREFEISDRNSDDFGLKQSFFSEDKLQDVTYELFTFRELAQNIRDRYYNCLYDIEQDKRSETFNLIAKVENGLDFLSFRLESFNSRSVQQEKKKSIFSAFSSPDKSLESEKASLLEDSKTIVTLLRENKIFDILSEPVQISDLPTFITDCQEIVSRFKTKIEDKISLFIKSSNKLNATDQKLEILEADFKVLIEDINRSGLFKKPIELNTLSFRKQVDCITQLVYDIDIMLLRVDKNLAYYRWTVFYAGLESKCQKLIDVLRKIDPQGWLSLFEAWYYFEILNKEKYKGASINLANVEEAIQSNENKQRSDIFQAINIWKSKYPSILEELKKSNPKLYTSLSKRKKYTEDNYWKHILEENTSFFSKVFPILIVDSDDLKNLTTGHYTELFYIDPLETNVEILQDFQTIYTYLDSERINDFAGDIHLKDMSHKMVQKISEYGMSERMPVIRNTVQCLTSCEKKPVIYHLRSASIVSYSNERIHTQLENSLHHFGIKRIISEESISDTLIATLLDVKKTVFVITDDYLLDSENSTHYLYQSQMIEAISKAGCKVIHVDHYELFIKGNDLIDEISDQIASVNISKIDHKNQIEFELS